MLAGPGSQIALPLFVLTFELLVYLFPCLSACLSRCCGVCFSARLLELPALQELGPVCLVFCSWRVLSCRWSLM